MPASWTATCWTGCGRPGSDPSVAWPVAVIGVGMVAERVHLPYLQAAPDVKIVGVYDTNPRRLKAVATAFDLPRFETARDVMASAAEIVWICTPPRSHGALIKEALAGGKHVVCEKPLCTSSAEAGEVARMATATGRHVFCCMTNRYRQDVTRMTAEVRAGTIGIPTYVRATWLRSAGLPGTTGALEAGVLWDIGSHLVDLVFWITGWDRPTRVTARAVRTRPRERAEYATWYGHGPLGDAGEDCADTAIVDLACGEAGLAHVEVSWAAHVPADYTEILVLGTSSALRLSTVFGWSPARQRIEGPALTRADTARGVWSELLGSQDRAHTEYVAQLDHFFDALNRGQPLAAELESTILGVNVLTCAHADIRESGDEGGGKPW